MYEQLMRRIIKLAEMHQALIDVTAQLSESDSEHSLNAIVSI